MKKNIKLLKKELDLMNGAKDVLEYSYKSCSTLHFAIRYI